MVDGGWLAGWKFVKDLKERWSRRTGVVGGGRKRLIGGDCLRDH